jgi:hypothetical protein
VREYTCKLLFKIEWFGVNEMSNSIIDENANSRGRLAIFIQRLTDEELNHPMDAGWTVSGILAHIAFWDQRAVVLLRKWKQDGIAPSPIDTDIVNEATRQLCLSIPPNIASHLVLTSALEIDREIEQLGAETLEEVETTGKTVRLNRALHRGEHLAQIELALAQAKQ